MARRQSSAQLDLVLPDESGSDEAPRRVPQRTEKRAWRRLRRIAVWTGAAASVAGAAVAWYSVDHFLASDSRFALDSRLIIEGAVYTPASAIEAVFARDFGRSVYLAPLADRRRRLLAIDWVRDAAVSRRWPNRIAVRIVERTPVAFLVFEGAAPALIDGDGVILTWPRRANLRLPVLTGITPGQPLEARRRRVREAVELLGETRKYAGQISEIDAADPYNLKITYLSQGRAFRLWLGDRNYGARMANFEKFYGDIGRRLPFAHVFDLRLDDRITVPAEGNPEPPKPAPPKKAAVQGGKSSVR